MSVDEFKENLLLTKFSAFQWIIISNGQEGGE